MIVKPKYLFLISLTLSAASVAALFHTFDDPYLIAKGFLFAVSLIAIGIKDGLTHEIPNAFLLPVLASGLIHFQPVSALEGFFQRLSCF